MELIGIDWSDTPDECVIVGWVDGKLAYTRECLRTPQTFHYSDADCQESEARWEAKQPSPDAKPAIAGLMRVRDI